ncbi:MAG TPA: peptidoglycan editing factor PgeF [Alloacidobacterium sp.]|nr:peptidoglycan editing factor PgeF [Alloacidobacterium sp.]
MSSIPERRVSTLNPGNAKTPDRQRKPRATKAQLEVVQVPAWSKLPWLMHGFSTRTGGRTTVYRPTQRAGELNLGFTATDTREAVLANLRLFVSAVTKSTGTTPLVTLRQIHSSIVQLVGKADAGEQAIHRADGMMTNEPGILLGIQTADCIPVLIADRKKRAVAAFHAGWRGTLKRIVESGVGRMRLEFGSRPEDLIAAIGPGIGGCCYAVGEEVQMEFESQFAYASELFSEVYDSNPIKEKYPLLFMTARAPGHSNIGPALHLDLVEANRRQLLDAGLSASNIFIQGDCTSCRTDRYFSHRADHGFTGRSLSVIGTCK